MKKLLLIIVSLFSVVSTNAQEEKLIYEKNWEGVEYSEWVTFETVPDWMYEATAGGLAITNPTVNDHIFDVRVQNGFFSLEEGHDYLVRLTIKLPSEGNIFMLLGSMSSSWYDTVPVTASDDWQVIDIESPNYYCDISDYAFVLLGLGEMVGTTILKKVQVYERTTQDTYRPFVEDGKVWKVGDYSGNPVRRVEYYYFDGDTIIDGKTCKQMMWQRYVNPDHPDYAVISQLPTLSYMGAWYEENKKVYQYDSRDKQFKLVYDFSLEDNGTFQTNDLSYVVGPRQTGGINGFKGVHRDVMMPLDGELLYNTTWLEGVGGIDGPMVRVYYGQENHAVFLMSCTVGDEVIYFNDEYEDGATPAGARKQRIDFTHTTKIKPKTRSKQEESDARISSSERDVARPKIKTRTNEEAEVSLYGEYSEKQLSINLNPISDAYMVSITNDSGKVVYEKPINAGNIVGLNIDISQFAKGDYTITIENSNESFIGEFKAQTTGIEAIRSKKPEVGGYIYNFQGQRLSSLQKGLNIVNGQKVYVK